MSKKTTEIIIDTGNDYVIAVKKNQPQLYQQIEEVIQETGPMDWDYTLEKNRGRIEQRVAMIYDPIGISRQDWKGLSQVIHVIRKVEHVNGNHSRQDAYYIDSTGKSARDLNQGIRGHWSIENTLHWTKDVVFKEDASKIHLGQAPENLSLIKNWVMAIFRKNGYESMISAVRMVANDLDLMVNLLE